MRWDHNIHYVPLMEEEESGLMKVTHQVTPGVWWHKV